MGIDILEQHVVLNFKLDWYLPQFNLAIEYDEYHHKGQQVKDRLREGKVIKTIEGLDFIRVDENNEIEGFRKILQFIGLRKKQISEILDEAYCDFYPNESVYFDRQKSCLLFREECIKRNASWKQAQPILIESLWGW